MDKKKRVLLFYFAYGMYIISKVINRAAVGTPGNLLKNLLTVISLLIMLFNILFVMKEYQYKKSRLISIMMILMVSFLSVISRDSLLLCIILLGLNALFLCDDEATALFKISFWTIGFTSVCIVLLCKIGMIKNISTARVLGGPERYAWGFLHSQILPIIIFYLIGDNLTYKKKCNGYLLLAAFLVSAIIDKKFDSRNALLSSTMITVLSLSWLLVRNENNSQRARTILRRVYSWGAEHMACILSLFSVFSVILYHYGVGIAKKMDAILSSRLKLADERFTSVPVQMIRVVSYGEYQKTAVSAIDNGFLYIISRYGWLYLIIFVIVSYFIAKFFIRTDNIFGIVFFTTALISCFITNEIVSCNFIPFWVIGIREILSVRKIRELGPFTINNCIRSAK